MNARRTGVLTLMGLVLVSLTSLLAGCGGGGALDTGAPPRGRLILMVNWPAELHEGATRIIPEGTDLVRVTVSGQGMQDVCGTCTKDQVVDGEARIELDVDAGQGRNVLAEAVDTDPEPDEVLASGSATVDIIAGRTNEVHISMQQGPALSVTPTELDFGATETELILHVRNAGGGAMTWAGSADQPWISLDPNSGTDDVDVKVRVDRTGLSPGSHEGTVTVDAGEAGMVEVDIALSVPSGHRLVHVTSGAASDQTPSLFQDRGGLYWLAFDSDRAGGVTHIFLTKSADGENWAPPEQVTSLDGDWAPHFFQDAGGRYWIAFGYANGGQHDIAVTCSDDGTSWTVPTPVVTGSTHQFEPSMMQDSAGTYWMAYNTYAGIYLIGSADGLAWGSPQQVVSGSMACSPSLLQDQDGKYWIAYHQRVAEPFVDYPYVIHSSDGLNWSSPALVASGKARACSLTQDGEGRFWIAYDARATTDAPVDMFIANSADGIAWAGPQPLADNTTDLDEMNPFLMQDSNGTYWIAFQSNRTGDYDIWLSGQPSLP